jgi:hypothetical protein
MFLCFCCFRIVQKEKNSGSVCREVVRSRFIGRIQPSEEVCVRVAMKDEGACSCLALRMCETVMVIVEEYFPGWNSTGILRVSEALWKAIHEGGMTSYRFPLALVDTMLCVERTL